MLKLPLKNKKRSKDRDGSIFFLLLAFLYQQNILYQVYVEFSIFKEKIEEINWMSLFKEIYDPHLYHEIMNIQFFLTEM